jgi:hypothetical protein
MLSHSSVASKIFCENELPRISNCPRSMPTFNSSIVLGEYHCRAESRVPEKWMVNLHFG